MAGRPLAFKVRDAHGKWQKLYFFTTFTLPPEQILRVYDVRSPDMAGKELVLGVAAYNLTRAAMNEAASALHLDPRQFSFSMAQDTIQAFLPVFAQARSDEERRKIMQEMLRVFSYSTLPHRHKRRSAPREIWPRPWARVPSPHCAVLADR